ncbi:Sodium/calcium exchanger 2 [Strongyloides ratti]|uniref:Sodium/calcium exchanger 2 n=1 Tax=Strongyloides ratti TaxID=34506 RepID=A0A090KWF4_STRRB|nr:Sodium/calcium exchanger 2 [Strongyloides ratti]CEF61835.1 Sodium/calcium exchanger 2 [Strongyloides ratti]
MQDINEESIYVVSFKEKLKNITEKVLNSTIPHNEECSDAKPCSDGLIIPAWTPVTGISIYTKIWRGFVYFLALTYLFYGVSIVADRFMSAIEVITSQEKEVKLKKANGEPYTVLVRIWNETVSNLTLMALGSSAPEILLSVIEIFANNFEAGDLGPSTIVGSAAFNLFVIIAICILCVPSNEIRRIDRLDVFWTTVIWSTFAYIWLYLILEVFSPNIVEVWEGVLTFMFFPLTVLTAFYANTRTVPFGQKIITARTGRAIIRRDPENNKESLKRDTDVNMSLLDQSQAASVLAYQNQKRIFMETFHQLRNENPDLSISELEQLATETIVMSAPKSRAFYRIQASRELTGSGSFGPKRIKKKAKALLTSDTNENNDVVTVEFETLHTMCLENCGTTHVRVKCDRGGLKGNINVRVNYRTEPGTAEENTDFVPTSGVLLFKPGEEFQTISIKIVDNDIYEDDETFTIVLSNATAEMTDNNKLTVPARLGVKSVATILIIDDDHSGHFMFKSEVQKVPENVGIYALEVQRSRGARGKVRVPFTVKNGMALEGRDFIIKTNELIFDDGQTKAFINIDIINDDEYEKSEDFFIYLEEPVSLDGNTGPVEEGEPDGSPQLGEITRCKIVITEDKEFKSFVDKMITSANTSLLVGTSSWKQQFSEIFEVEDSDGDGTISTKEKCLHYFSLPWKAMFALIPPTEYYNGWLCFFVSIVVIGILTAIIGDVASHFGCTIGLKDSVTAVSLVALGTSIPDTFASKTAAIQDKYADSSIGNVTGSNAVNVFLGIGIAWAIAAFYHSRNGTQFKVNAGSLAFSVTLFVIGSSICIGLLMYRRSRKNIGGELGGPAKTKIISGCIFIAVWLMYLTLSILDAYCIL